MKLGHILIYIILLLTILGQILFVPVKTTTDDLYISAKQYLIKNNITKVNLNEFDFNLRNNNLWINLIYYKMHSEKLKIYFGKKNSRLPEPSYPLLSIILKPLLNEQLLPPINLVEIASYLRRNLSSGITIRTKNYLINSKNIQNMSTDQIAKLLNQYKKKILNRYILQIIGNTQKINSFQKNHFVSYKNFPDFKNIFNQLNSRKIKITSYSVIENPKFKQFFNKQSNKSTSSKQKPKELFSESIRFQNINEKISTFEDLRSKLAKVYTIAIEGTDYYNKPLLRQSIIRLGNFPNFKAELNHFKSYNKIVISESKILKYKSNSREFVDQNQIPKNVKKGFILVEDDNFYYQGGGFNLIRLIKATYNYMFHNSKKGNASIMEQVYEMYVGSSNKTAFDKFIQILGTIYYSYYHSEREPFLNLYIQSIPGSFWRDHNYGMKGIIKNYLNKNSLDEVNIGELAWICRIALLPNVFGQDYIRYHIIKETLKEHKVDINNNNQLKKFLTRNKKNKKIFIKLKKENKESEYDVIQRLKRSYIDTKKRIKTALDRFLKGNEYIKPLITAKKYNELLKHQIVFKPSNVLNEYQSYTDQTRKDLLRYLGGWALNSGIDVEVDFDENAQNILDQELIRSTRTLNYHRYIKRYGGGAILIKTHEIKTRKIVNRIVAIASRHTKSGKNYFNWAVDGHRHFGSIFKWAALLLYLDRKGTLFDTFYDIPRKFKYYVKSREGRLIQDTYTPDNWRVNRDDDYGHFTYSPQDNIYNFIQSKNNTFVKIAEILTKEEFSNFLNELSEIKNPREKFQPIYPVVLGSQEINSIRFAQINSVIANQGILQPLVTITRLVEPNGSSLYLNLSKLQKQVVKREAAEASLFCGYLNTYFGTANRFFSGGAGKTGSSDTDVSFLAMTLRTPEEYIQSDKDHLLNSNLLYLVNVGVNVGKIDDGLFGGTIGALNSRAVFEKLFKYQYKKGIKKLKHKISGNFMKYFSKKFTYKKTTAYAAINGKPIMVPILKYKAIYHEPALSQAQIEKIKQEYMERKDTQRGEQLAKDLAKADGYYYPRLSKRKKEEYLQRAMGDINSKNMNKMDKLNNQDELYNKSESEMSQKNKKQSSRHKIHPENTQKNKDEFSTTQYLSKKEQDSPPPSNEKSFEKTNNQKSSLQNDTTKKSNSKSNTDPFESEKNYDQRK